MKQVCHAQLFAVVDKVRQLCILVLYCNTGWHIPSDETIRLALKVIFEVVMSVLVAAGHQRKELCRVEAQQRYRPV